MVDGAYAFAALLLVAASALAWRASSRRLGRGLGAILAGLALFPGVSAVWIASGRFRPAPAPFRREIAPRVWLEREVLRSPRPVVLHWLEVSLGAESPRLHIRAPDLPDGRFRARTPQAYLQETGYEVALSLSYFYPIHETFVWWSYPRPGDPITAVGRHCSAGACFGEPWTGARVYLTPHPSGRGTSVSTVAPARLHHAVEGRGFLLGKDRRPADGDFDDRPYPRTVLGLMRSSRDAEVVLGALVVDGKQPGYSEGLTMEEVRAQLTRRGFLWALELDGGGSAALAGMSAAGRPQLLSSPSHTHVPGRARPVALFLAVEVP